MAKDKFFKVTGMINGLHIVEHEDARTEHMDEVQLAGLKREAKCLTTNEAWPNRPQPAVEIAASGDVTGAVAELAVRLTEITRSHAALEARVVELENAADEKKESGK